MGNKCKQSISEVSKMSEQHTPNQQGAIQFSQQWQTRDCPECRGKEVFFLKCKVCPYHIHAMGYMVICRKQIELNEIRSRA